MERDTDNEPKQVPAGRGSLILKMLERKKALAQAEGRAAAEAVAQAEAQATNEAAAHAAAQAEAQRAAQAAAHAAAQAEAQRTAQAAAHAAAQAAAQAAAEARARTASVTTPGPSVSQVPSVTSSSSEITCSSLGMGRAKLLENYLKQPKTVERSDDKPSLPAVSHGRGSILKAFKNVGSVGAPIEPPSIPGPSGDNAGVLGKLSDLAISETKSTSVISYQKPLSVPYQGTSGTPIQLSANYINIKLTPGKGLFNYEIKFKPEIDSIPLRRKLLNQHLAALGRTKVFDGVTLYLPVKLKDDRTIFESVHPADESTVTLTIIYKKQQSMTENIPFFNVLLNRVMRALSLVRIGPHNFNPRAIHSVPQHKLEVWPGYVTAINEYEDGLKLCIDAKHRVMRTETVRDIMVSHEGKNNFKQVIEKELQGVSVFTRYNNKTYRVDDIVWNKSPKDKFAKDDKEISFIEYYKNHWNLQIRDSNQPLLLHVAKVKTPTGGPQEKYIFLVPELCYIASLTESIRSDYKIVRDLDTVTKMTPNNRRAVLKHFVQEVQKNDAPREILSEWGLELQNELTEFKGRTLAAEKIYFGNNVAVQLPTQKPAEWSVAACRNHVLRTPHLNHWCVLYFQRDMRCAKEFVEMLMKVSTQMGMKVNEPKLISLRDDRSDTYTRELRANIQENINIMVVIVPSNRTDRYSAIKKLCNVERPIPSQVIVSRTISRGDKLKSVTEKIALQINCKLGGALWALSVPLDECMICGIDVYHGTAGQSGNRSVAAFVASLDKLLTTWHSKVCLQGKHQELVDMLQQCLLSAVKAYYKHNGYYPSRIIVYRDGVGEGQMATVANYEVKQMLETFKRIEPNYAPSLTVIIVHKRINTRLFAVCSSGLENPLPGTVVDGTITRPELYDFFLVSQTIRQGTVSPTHYIVVYDSKNMKAEHVQKLTYKLCHLYYNWPGTIKVPAPCQYAHKLASLIGQNVQMEPHQSLANTLFYL